MRGHYAYYGITGNSRRLSWYAIRLQGSGRSGYRGGASLFHWNRFNDFLKRHPLPSPDRPSLHCCERSSLVKNRMREICAYGTVRGEGGNIPPTRPRVTNCRVGAPSSCMGAACGRRCAKIAPRIPRDTRKCRKGQTRPGFPAGWQQFLRPTSLDTAPSWGLMKPTRFAVSRWTYPGLVDR